MIVTTREERRWLVYNLAQGLVDYIGVAEPPVPVEQLLKHPPDLYAQDFGVVDMYSTLWDATFARPPGRRGSVFVQIDLPQDRRRFALARETLSAIITSRHGREMGLADLLLASLREAGEYFARILLAPDGLLTAFIRRGGDANGFPAEFVIPPPIAAKRWEDTYGHVT